MFRRRTDPHDRRPTRAARFVRSAASCLVALACLPWLAPAAAVAQDAPPAGVGTRAPSGSKINAEVGNIIENADDSDVYEFDGFSGQTVSVAVKRGKVGALVPEITLFRPDGSEVFPADGVVFKPAHGPTLKPPATRKATFALDTSGTWTVRVRGAYPTAEFDGDDPNTTPVEDGYLGFDYPAGRTTGTYTYSVKLTPYTGFKLKNVVPDASGQYRFAIPSAAGGTVSAKLKWSGTAPTFLSATGPDGAALAGFSGSVNLGASSGSIAPVVLPVNSGAGATVVTLQLPAGATPPGKFAFAAKYAPPRDAPKAMKTTFDKEEPFITQINPARGGPGTILTVVGGRLFDSGAPGGTPRVRLGRNAYLTNTSITSNNTVIFGTVPAGVPADGDLHVVLESSAGQAHVMGDGFRRVPPPTVTSIDPVVGPDSGGFTITIHGADFSTTPGDLVPIIDGNEFAFSLGSVVVTPTSFSFTMPVWPAGLYTFGLKDKTSGLSDNLGLNSFEFTVGAAISRVTPGLIPVTGGEVMTISGANFTAIDRVFLERTEGSPGAHADYDEMAVTFLDSRRLQFTAPPKSKGTYRVKVRNQFDVDTPTRTFAYYTITDFSNALGLPGGADGFEAVATAVADIDLDGDPDMVLSRPGAAGVATSPHTRVLLNDGTGRLSDVTGGTNPVMPAVLADDDWRADGMKCVDVTADGYADIVIVTNNKTIPPASRSHVRFLINEKRSGLGPATDRVFRDRTQQFAPPNRQTSGGTQQPWNWHGFDVWVGDIDAASGVPEIIVTSDELKEDLNTQCGNYCSQSGGFGVIYNFYWGGSALWVWDKNANSGQGRYKYDHNFFPRKSGVVVPIANPPPGVTIPSCAGGGACRGKFTPFAGQKVAVGPLNADARPDVVVINRNDVPQGAGSPLQVGINQFDSTTGSGLTDHSAAIGGLSGNFKADTAAIGQTGYPDGTGVGFLVVSKSAPAAGGPSLKMFKYVAPVTGQVGSFLDVTSLSLPATGVDVHHSSAIRFLDIDSDGDQDMISVAATAPGGTEPAIRLWTNDVVSGQVGVFRERLKPLVAAQTTVTNRFEGSCLAIGDMDGDGGLEFVVTRAGAPGTAPHTRAISIDK
ncbi:MAG: hypothetical protein HMLKMBBP_01626 [Planctomycetes bacterium]|nr:hypothetical protein [Planctomycetota bacterium]